MNDDLISRKALLKQFSISDSGRRIPEYDIDNFPITLSIKDVKEIVRKAPTAFDKEKVIEELDKLTGEECTLHECGIRSERCKPCIAKKAIEIVEKGGIG